MLGIDAIDSSVQMCIRDSPRDNPLNADNQNCAYYTTFPPVSYTHLILPGLAIAVRRLHDTNKSGWFFLINFIPIVGPIWFLILMLTKGDTYTNNYGERTSYIQITPDIQRQYGLRPSPTSTSTALYIIAYVVLISISIGLSAATIATSFNSINNTTPTHYSTNTNSNNSSVKATPTPQPASTNTQSVAQNNAVEESTKALQNYYRYLTNKYFANAYTYPVSYIHLLMVP